MTKKERVYCREAGIRAFIKNKYVKYGVKINAKYGIDGLREFKEGYKLLPNLQLFINTMTMDNIKGEK